MDQVIFLIIYNLKRNLIYISITEEFEPFLKSYIANFQHRSLVTSEFVDYLKQYFSNTLVAKKLDQVDWDTWFHKPGMPIAFAK